MGKKKQVPLNLNIDEDTHAFFKQYAKKRHDTMTRLIIEYIKGLEKAEEKKSRGTS